MSRPELTETYSPPMAPHVTGRYSRRAVDPETKEPGEQRWEASCGKCGATIGPAPCASGMVRQHIASFASSHTHRDALNDKFPGGDRNGHPTPTDEKSDEG